MKQARTLLAAEKVLSSNWQAPLLKGVVQEGSASYRAGLVIKDEVNIENLCGCRPSREWGTICSHSVAVGLHHLKEATGPGLKDRSRSHTAGAPEQRLLTSSPTNVKRLRRADGSGEPMEIFIILPPNFDQAGGRGKGMLWFEGKWAGGRGALNA